MATKEQALAIAQRNADQSGKDVAVLNLNPYSGDMYVARKWDDRFTGARDLVARVHPNKEVAP